MKLLFLMTLFSFSVFGEVVQVPEDALDQDLSFKHEQEQSKDRDVASDGDTPKNKKDENFETERIRFWKY